MSKALLVLRYDPSQKKWFDRSGAVVPRIDSRFARAMQVFREQVRNYGETTQRLYVDLEGRSELRAVDALGNVKFTQTLELIFKA